jgi:SNF family Na+-dependent transporter
MFAYGSYNKTREPLIFNAFLIGIIDFLFSFIAGFGVWGGIGYLQMKDNISYTQSSSVGLIFIAMPAAAVESGESWTLGLLMFTLWLSGIDSAVGFVEGIVTNIIDYTGCKRW